MTMMHNQQAHISARWWLVPAVLAILLVIGALKTCGASRERAQWRVQTQRSGR